MDALSDPAKLGAIGTLTVCLISLAGWHAKAVATWSQERQAILDAARAERDKLLADARAERERIERDLAAERAQIAAVYERRVEEQREAADKLFEQNSNWMDLISEVGKVLTTLNERVAAFTTSRGR